MLAVLFFASMESALLLTNFPTKILFGSVSYCPPHFDGQWFTNMCKVSFPPIIPFTYKISRVRELGANGKLTLYQVDFRGLNLSGR
jgi:hypothetical protein